jgi:phage tail sheath protein FI
MPIYSTPGVYYEWMDTRSDNIVATRTDIAGFVGVAERGPLQQPTQVESWNQFTTLFGGLVPQGFLAYAVQGFFNNGGRRCWIVRVGNPSVAKPAMATLPDTHGDASLTLEAYSPGAWGEQISISVVNTTATRFNLTFRLPDGTQEFWPNLSLDSGDSRYAPRILNDSRTGSRLVRIQTLNTKPSLQKNPAVATPADVASLLMKGGGDGLAKAERDGVPSATEFVKEMTDALATLELIDEIAIVAMPDAVIADRTSPAFKQPRVNCAVLDELPEAARPLATTSVSVPVLDENNVTELQSALIQHCEKLKDRIAILDAPAPVRNPDQILNWRNQFRSRFAALYYPWVKVPDPLGKEGLLRTVPPSGHVAGIYAQVEHNLGPHKPPANELLEMVEDVSVLVAERDHGFLNTQGINVIRPFNGRQIRIAGARMLTEPNDTLWQFVNVRRLFLMIERSIQSATQWMVFEPDNQALWREIERVVRSFLDDLWRKGLLDGASAEQAYSVKCDSTTNPPPETDNGRVICEIGVLPPWPAEFVIARIGITPSGTEVLNAMEAQSA